MPEYLSPGVYVEEVDSGSKPIEGVSTSTAGMVGVTERGPCNVPILVTSPGEFTRTFGGFLPATEFGSHRYLPHAVEGFFSNGGKRLYVVRICPAGATPATLTLTERTGANPQLISIHALSPGSWGRRLRIGIQDEEIGLANAVRLEKVDGSTTEVKVDSLSGIEVGTILLTSNAVSGVDVEGPLKVETVDRVNFKITLAGTGLSSDQDTALSGDGLLARSHEFNLTVQLMRRPDPTVPSRNNEVIATEAYQRLSMDPRHSRYILKVIGDIKGDLRLSDRLPEGASAFIRIEDLAPTDADKKTTRLGPNPKVNPLPNGLVRPGFTFLNTGGIDNVLQANGEDKITDSDYIGVDNADPELRTGMQSLINKDNISLVAVPGVISTGVQVALVDHCELMRFRFAVLDGPAPRDDDRNVTDTISDVIAHRQQFDTKCAAIYHPWVCMRDPFSTNVGAQAKLPIPPSGHMLGLYARIDVERGVHKAPANEVVRNIIGLGREVVERQQEVLNPSPNNINVIRDFRSENRGIRVWGARVITSDPDWKYVPVRRTFLFLEQSIQRGIQWAVFEPNDEPLWARVRITIENFLTRVWLDGALQGATTEEAFFVRCDRTTMTQDDIDNGRLICLVGVAIVRPAEFVIVRIGQNVQPAS